LAERFIAQAGEHVRHHRDLLGSLDKDSADARTAASELAAYEFALEQHRLRGDQIRSSLLKGQLECHLDAAERQVANGQRYVSEQKRAIELLTTAGLLTADAQLLLATYEFALVQKIRHRDQLRRRHASEAAARSDELPHTPPASELRDSSDRQSA
jgi:hypothetical protein